MKHYTVYKITNLINNKIYIGKHETQNLDDGYMGSGKLLKRALQKYNKVNFSKEILFVFDNEEEMNNKEAELVNEEFIKEVSNYNLCVGGRGGFSYINSTYSGPKDHFKGKKHTLETRKRISEKSVGWSVCNDQKKNIGHFKGKKHTLETRKRMSESARLRTGKNNSQYGTKWIHNLESEKNKKIKKEDQVPEGWSLGRKMKF